MAFRLRRVLVNAAMLALVAALHAGCAPAAFPGGARVQATFYELRLPESKVSARMMDELRSAADIEVRLASYGKAKVLYQMDQAVTMGEETTLKVSSRVPYVSQIYLDEHDRRTQHVGTAGSIGVSLDVLVERAAGPSGDEFYVQLEADLSAQTDSPAGMKENVDTQVEREVQLRYAGRVRRGRPILVMAVDTSTTDRQGQAVAYIARIVVTPAANGQ